jgi:hypothetical protein
VTVVEIITDIVGVPATAAQEDMLFMASCIIGIVIVVAVAEIFYFISDIYKFRR